MIGEESVVDCWSSYYFGGASAAGRYSILSQLEAPNMDKICTNI